MRYEKTNYIQHVRNETLYPTYRGVVKVVAILFYCVAGVQALGGLLSGLGMLTSDVDSAPLMGIGVVIVSLLSAALLVALTRFMQEAVTMTADIADGLAELNTRQARTHSDSSARLQAAQPPEFHGNEGKIMQ